MPITLAQAKALKPGDILHHATHRNADGSPQRWRVNGIPQIWKRSPERVRVPLKYGLYAYDQLTESYLDQVSIASLVARCTLVHIMDTTGRESDYALDRSFTDDQARAHIAKYNPGATILTITREEDPQA